ncbi:MAG: YdcP family protein [Lachnospiraceae bacterium]|nr:YdcP family protein [Lachnospiraceae bacterium]
MRLSNGFVIDKEKTFGKLKFTAVRDVFLQNEDGTPSTQLKKRIYDLKCSLHGGIIPVSVPPEVPLREFPYNAVVELVNPVADTVSRKTYTGADVDWYVKAEDIVLKNKGNQNTGTSQNHTPQGQPKK